MDFCVDRHANPAGTRICGRCGQPITVWTCPAGHQESAATAVCRECGAVRPTTPVTPAAEGSPDAPLSSGRFALVAVAVVVGLVLAGLVGGIVVSRITRDDPTADDAAKDGSPPETLAGARDDAWPPGFKRRTVSSCVAASSGDLSRARAQCSCIFDELERDVSYERMLELDEQVRDEPGTVPAELEAARDACA